MSRSMVAALAWGGVVLAGALWGAGALVAQWLMAGGMAPHTLALARFALGLPLLWWWHWRQRPACGAALRMTGRERLLVAGTGAAMALNVSCWFAGIEVLGAALPTIISICCAPAIVAGVAALRGWERLTPRVAAALLLALGGVLLVAVAPGGLALPARYAAGIAWSLASAVLHAAVVLGNARMPARIPAVTASAWGMTAAALCMLPVAALQGLHGPAGAQAWLGLAYTGVVTTSIAYLLFAWGARRLGPTAAGVCTLVEPLVATLLAAWLFAHPLAPQQWLGAVLLAAAMVLLTRS
ncbi:MAG: DMT family transporter [Burkholderiales bacterium]|nr:DMT family transporter [Burkholderiales bacterium]